MWQCYDKFSIPRHRCDIVLLKKNNVGNYSNSHKCSQNSDPSKKYFFFEKPAKCLVNCTSKTWKPLKLSITEKSCNKMSYQQD
jgi:hypothetical protein